MWSQPSAKSVAKSQEKELKGTNRDLERDLANLSRDEAKLEGEIKSAVKKGDQAGARILAKQLVRMREQKQRLLSVKGQVTSTQYSVKSAASQISAGQALAKTTTVMGSMNQQMNVGAMQKMAQQYEVQSSAMEFKSEAMDEVFDSVFEGDEEMEAGLMDQIYDEIGLEVKQSTPSVPSSINKSIVSDDQVEAFIKSQFSRQSAQ